MTVGRLVALAVLSAAAAPARHAPASPPERPVVAPGPGARTDSLLERYSQVRAFGGGAGGTGRPGDAPSGLWACGPRTQYRQRSRHPFRDHLDHQDVHGRRDPPAGGALLPEGGGRFAAYDPPTDQVVRIAFEGGDTRASAGLSVLTVSGTKVVEARRMR